MDTPPFSIDPLPEPDGDPVQAVDDATDDTATPQGIQQTHDPTPLDPHNPGIHESPPRVVTRAGQPQWAKRRGGAALRDREPGSIGRAVKRSKTERPEKTAKSEQPIGDSQSVDGSAGAAAVGTMAAAAFVTICRMLGGDEFAPEPGEQDALNAATISYCESSGVVDLPPGVSLAIVASVFIAKRWNAPGFTAKREEWAKKFNKKTDDVIPRE